MIESEVDMGFGRLIKEALEADGITQAEFARRVGVSTKHLCRVLNEEASTPLATYAYWAFVLGRRFNVKLVGRTMEGADSD